MEDNKIENDDLTLDFEDMPDLNLDDVEIAAEENKNDIEVGVEDNSDSNVFDDLVETMLPEKTVATEETESFSEEETSDKLSERDDVYDMEQKEDSDLSDRTSSYIPVTFGSDPNFIEWYSGSANEPIFEVSKTSESGEIIGDDEWQTIHLNVGLDTYGWQVQFSGGTIMSVDDVRIYQLRNGELPENDGVIIYGNIRIDFKNIKKITVYKSVRYFTYA